MRPRSRPNFRQSWRAEITDLISKGFRRDVLLRVDDCKKSSSSQLRATRKTARERVFPAPKTPAIQRSDRPVRMAGNSATVTVRMWPSPCPAKTSKLSRTYKSWRPGKVTVGRVAFNSIGFGQSEPGSK